MADHDELAAVVELGHPIKRAPGADPHLLVIFAARRTPQPEPVFDPRFYWIFCARTPMIVLSCRPHVLLAEVRFDGQLEPQMLRDDGAGLMGPHEWAHHYQVRTMAPRNPFGRRLRLATPPQFCQWRQMVGESFAAIIAFAVTNQNETGRRQIMPPAASLRFGAITRRMPYVLWNQR